MPSSPSRRTEQEPVHGMLRRRKAYLVATYTGQLDAEDALQPWFVYDQEDPDHQKLVEMLSDEDRRSLQPVRQRPPKPGYRRHTLPGEAETDEELADQHAVSQGWCTATNPATSATVHVVLKGTLGESGVHTLSHARPAASEGVFKPGSIDEFAISCEDLGDIHSLEVWHDNDGDDLQASRWKLDKVVVTCIQSTTNKGDFADKTKKTSSSDQWHFVLNDWLGCTPTEISHIDIQIESLQNELAKLLKTRREILGAPVVQECPHREVSLIQSEQEPTTVAEPAAAPTPGNGSNLRLVKYGIGAFLLLLLGRVLVVYFSPTSDDGGAQSVDAPPALPQCDSETLAAEECDCELWAKEEAAPTVLRGLCASTWDEIDRSDTWEAAEAHVRCSDCCASTGFEGAPTSFGDLDNSSDGGTWISTTLAVILCAVLVAAVCTCDARDGGARRRRLDGQLRAGWHGARRHIPPRRTGTVASPSSRRGRSRSPTRSRRSRSRSPAARPFASLSRDSVDSTYF